MSIKIVTDSSADLVSLPGADFDFAPLKIITADREYVDNENLDTVEMATEMQEYKGKSSTSCPNATDWLKAFGDAEQVICITITATLSGSYNSAVLAKQLYEKEHPGRRVFVFNSLTAGPEIAMMAVKVREMIHGGADFDTVCTSLTEYAGKTGLLFMLESLNNFANNGRVSPVLAKAVGLLGMRIVGKASDGGDLEPLNKCRGEAKGLSALISYLKDHGLDHGLVRIDHCMNEATAKKLGHMILAEFPSARVAIHECRGLCSFYAEMGGLLVGFEKF